jgi:hypothetical protein
MRTIVVLCFALSSLSTTGCHTCGDVAHGGTGFVNMALHLPPESTVTPPETVVVSSPVAMTGTVPSAPGLDGSFPDGSFSLMLQKSDTSIFSPEGSISADTTGGRVLTIAWYLTDWDASAPPSDQFDVTVTDASGKVTGQLTKAAEFKWVGPSTCEASGHWNGPTLSDKDGGVDHLLAF